MAKSRRKPSPPERRPATPVAERLREELYIYQEEARQQTEQLIEAQRALEESRERYVNLYDFGPIGYVTLDYNGIIESANLMAAEMLGLERARLVHTPLLAFVRQEDRALFLKHLLHCRRFGVPASAEVEFLPRNRPERLPVILRTWVNPHRLDPIGSRGFEFRTALLDLSERRTAQAQEARYRAHLRSLAAELGLAEERERRRIAVEVHDNISQALAMAKMRLESACRKAGGHAVAKDLCDVSDIVGEVLEQTRSLTFELSPPVLYELGFEPAIEWLAERTHKQYRLPVAVDLPKAPIGLAQDLAVMLFQATRELLVNVVKHARARQATVRLRRVDGSVDLTVEDDGRGFVAPSPAGGDHPLSGFGLFSIRARLEHLGGGLQVQSRDSSGSRVTLTVPLAARRGPPAREPDLLRDFEADTRPTPSFTVTPPQTNAVSEGIDHESTPRRRPSNRARRSQKPSGKSA